MSVPLPCSVADFLPQDAERVTRTPMTRAELDQALEAIGSNAIIRLTAADWIAMLGDPETGQHLSRSDEAERAYAYKGHRVWIISPGPSHVGHGRSRYESWQSDRRGS